MSQCIGNQEYLRDHHPKLFHNKKQKEHFSHGMFHGDDFDSTMLRIGAMNLMLHGIENPDILSFDSLSKDAAAVRERSTLVLANPPFKRALNYDETAADLLQVAKTKKTELLFMALFLAQRSWRRVRRTLIEGSAEVQTTSSIGTEPARLV